MSNTRWPQIIFCCIVSLWLNHSEADINSLAMSTNKQSAESLTKVPDTNALTDQRRIELAKQYIKANKGNDALKVLNPLLINSPNYEILLLAAQSYAELKNPSVAIDFYQKAREIADTDVKRQIVNKGIEKMQYWLSQGEPGVLQILSPREAMGLAKKYIDANQGGQALEALNPLLLNKPNYEVFLLAAQSYAEVGDPWQSLDLYKRAREMAQNEMQRQITESGILKMQAWINQSGVKQAPVPNNTQELIKKYIHENKGKDALDLLKPYLIASPDYDTLLLIAQSYAELENPNISLNYYIRALQKAKTDGQRKIAEAGILKMQAWINESQETKQVSYLNDQMDLARKYINKNKGKEALMVLKPFSKLKNYGVFLLTAQSYAELDNPAMSLEYYKKARQIANTKDEQKIAAKGIAKMNTWLAHPKPQNKPESPFDKELNLARKYISNGQGKNALEILKTRLLTNPKYPVFLLMAQGYAMINKPRQALNYYTMARRSANTNQERVVADFGIAKMQFWMSQYYRAMHRYDGLLHEASSRQDSELALAGKVKSLAYLNRPISGFKTIPKSLRFTTPQMVVAAAQASLWSDWADITKDIVTTNQSILDTIPLGSPLSKDLKDLTWQLNQATWPNEVSPLFYFFSDSEDFKIKREVLDYSHYWSQPFQTSIGVKAHQYRQKSAKLDAKSAYIGQTLRPTRQLILFGQVEPTDYSLWEPTLWIARANYRPNDFVAAHINASREVVETFAAFGGHITDNQYSASMVLNPIPYIQLNGAVNRLNFSDSNERKGYYISASALVSPLFGLSLILQERVFTDKFVSPLYFSPNRYVADTAILRLGSKAGSVWHYYIDGGLGRQHVQVNNVPSSQSPTYQWGWGINGPITNWLILSAYYSMSTQASSFIDSPGYRSQSGSVSLNMLLF
ncbi:hypothetical protein [Fluoribacter gormanii]|uniref:hypothetical protein n=1 Tax=Fluoribacter gormanii TaxID=464 RepID=UPI0010415D2C|nr:hypothetical protein [Fluoribacter gormanii]